MAEAKERVTQATEYVVLEKRTFKDDSSGEEIVAWVEAGEATGTTRLGVALDAADDKEGVWRPVPIRNWGQSIRTFMETKPKLRAEVIDD